MVAVSVRAMRAGVSAAGDNLAANPATRSAMTGLWRGVGEKKGVRGVRCALANSAGVPQQEGFTGAEELLELWAKQPASAAGQNAETEAVRRLFMWDALPKKGTDFLYHHSHPFLAFCITFLQRRRVSSMVGLWFLLSTNMQTPNWLIDHQH